MEISGEELSVLLFGYPVLRESWLYLDENVPDTVQSLFQQLVSAYSPRPRSLFLYQFPSYLGR
jgi:hypothetical protein